MPKSTSNRDLIRIGDRDGWVCGICRDPGRSVHRLLGAVTILASDLALEDVPPGEQVDGPWEDVDEATRHYDPLAASIDHILPKSRGGTDDDGNLQIAHLRCNLLKHNQAQPSPEYARARLSLTLHGTPVPYRVWRSETRARRREHAGRQARHLRRLPPLWMIDRGIVAVESWRLVVRYRLWRLRRRMAAQRRQRTGG